jgi:hypothetical protein
MIKGRLQNSAGLPSFVAVGRFAARRVRSDNKTISVGDSLRIARQKARQLGISMGRGGVIRLPFSRPTSLN